MHISDHLVVGLGVDIKLGFHHPWWKFKACLLVVMFEYLGVQVNHGTL